jgi:hypothetical protein
MRDRSKELPSLIGVGQEGAKPIPPRATPG